MFRAIVMFRARHCIIMILLLQTSSFFIRCGSDVYVKRHVLQLHIWKTWKNVNDKGWSTHKVLSHAIHILFSYLTYYSSFHSIFFSYLFSASSQSWSFKFIRLYWWHKCKWNLSQHCVKTTAKYIWIFLHLLSTFDPIS